MSTHMGVELSIPERTRTSGLLDRNYAGQKHDLETAWIVLFRSGVPLVLPYPAAQNGSKPLTTSA